MLDLKMVLVGEQMLCSCTWQRFRDHQTVYHACHWHATRLLKVLRSRYFSVLLRSRNAVDSYLQFDFAPLCTPSTSEHALALIACPALGGPERSSSCRAGSGPPTCKCDISALCPIASTKSGLHHARCSHLEWTPCGRCKKSNRYCNTCMRLLSARSITVDRDVRWYGAFASGGQGSMASREPSMSAAKKTRRASQVQLDVHHHAPHVIQDAS